MKWQCCSMKGWSFSVNTKSRDIFQSHTLTAFDLYIYLLLWCYKYIIIDIAEDINFAHYIILMQLQFWLYQSTPDINKNAIRQYFKSCVCSSRINNCVGEDNHWLFLQLCFYTQVLSLFTLVLDFCQYYYFQPLTGLDQVRSYRV